MGEQTVKPRKKEDVNGVKINPLRNERIFVRFVPQASTFASGNNPHHLASGGLIEGGSVTLCAPMLKSGHYKNVLTDAEKDFLEEALGLDFNALSVYNRTNNFWDTYTVRIEKEGLHLNLMDPEDFLRYKVLLANSDIIAPSVQARMDRPKVTYRFELVNDTEETNIENAKMDATMQCYMEFGKIKDDNDKMRVLVELLDNHPYAPNTSSEFLKSRLNQLIQANAKEALRQMTDPLLHAKVLLRRGVEIGIVAKRGDYYYMKSDNSPLCEAGEDPTLSVAARFINLPSHQDVKFVLESGVGNKRGK